MSKKESSVYLLCGNEQFLKEENLARIKNACLDKKSGSFNFNVFYAGTTPIEKILECAYTLPFLGRKRVVLVRTIEDLNTSERKLILSYLRTPQKTTCLVLETSDNINQNFFAEICKSAQVIFCNPLQGNRLFTWIKGQIEPKGKRIEQQALRLLIDNLGNNLVLLSTALENLTLYIGNRETIKLDDVEKLVGLDLATNAFELFDALVIQDKRKALQILDRLFKDGLNSSQILGALTYQIISQRRRLDSAQFACVLEELQKTDVDIKTGRQTQRIALEVLLVRLLQLL